MLRAKSKGEKEGKSVKEKKQEKRCHDSFSGTGPYAIVVRHFVASSLYRRAKRYRLRKSKSSPKKPLLKSGRGTCGLWSAGKTAFDG